MASSPISPTPKGASTAADESIQPLSTGSSTVGPRLTGEQDQPGCSSQGEGTGSDCGVVDGGEVKPGVAAPMSRHRTGGMKVVYPGPRRTPGNTGSTNMKIDHASSGNKVASRNEDQAAGSSQTPDQGGEDTRVATTTASPAIFADSVGSRGQKSRASIICGNGGAKGGPKSAAVAGATGSGSALEKGGPDDGGGKTFGNASAGVKATVAKQRSRSRIRTAASAKGSRARACTPAGLRTDDDIQGMVDKIKSRNPNNGGGRQAKGGPWIPEEDEALREIVHRDGERKWNDKAAELNTAMKTRYEAMAAEAADKGEEPVRYGRVAAQCLHRWKKVLQPGLNKGHWTSREDEVVRKTVTDAAAVGEKVKWSLVASLLPGRLGKQCRERWFNHLDPSVKKTEWTPREDEVLFNAQTFFGTRWCEIAKFLPGRTENAVKNRYNSSARQKWFESQPQQVGGGAAAAKKKATSRIFLDRLRLTLQKKLPGKGGGGSSGGGGGVGTISRSDNKRSLEQEDVPQAVTPSAGRPSCAPAGPSSKNSLSHKPAKKQRSLAARKLKLKRQRKTEPSSARPATVAQPAKILRAAQVGAGGDGPSADKRRTGTAKALLFAGPKPEPQPQPQTKAQTQTQHHESQKQKQPQRQLQRKQDPQRKKMKHGDAGDVCPLSSSEVPLREISDGDSDDAGGRLSPDQAKESAAAGQPRARPPVPHVVAVSAKERLVGEAPVESTAPEKGKVPTHSKAAAGGGGGGVRVKGKGKSKRRAEKPLPSKPASGPWLVEGEGGESGGGPCRIPTRQPRTERTPQSVSGVGGKEGYGKAAGTPRLVGHAEAGRKNGEGSADAAAAVVKAEAAERYMRGEWTLPPPPPRPSPTPDPQPHRYLEFGATATNETPKVDGGSSNSNSSRNTENGERSFASTPSTAELSSSESSAATPASVRSGGGRSSRVSSSGRSGGSGGSGSRSVLLGDASRTIDVRASRNGRVGTGETGRVGARGDEAPGRGSNTPIRRTPSTLFALDGRSVDGWRGTPSAGVPPRPSRSRSTNSTSSIRSSSARAAAFTDDFLVDDVRPAHLPFAPAEAWRMSRTMGAGIDSRTSSAASIMMMMMFGVGVGASGVFDGKGAAPPSGGDGASEADVSGVVAAAAEVLRSSQQVLSGSVGGGDGDDHGAGSASGSGSSLPRPSVLAARGSPSPCQVKSEVTTSRRKRVEEEGGKPTVTELGHRGSGGAINIPSKDLFIGASPDDHLSQWMASSSRPCTSPRSASRSIDTNGSSSPAAAAAAATAAAAVAVAAAGEGGGEGGRAGGAASSSWTSSFSSWTSSSSPAALRSWRTTTGSEISLASTDGGGFDAGGGGVSSGASPAREGRQQERHQQAVPGHLRVSESGAGGKGGVYHAAEVPRHKDGLPEPGELTGSTAVVAPGGDGGVDGSGCVIGEGVAIGSTENKLDAGTSRRKSGAVGSAGIGNVTP